MGHIDSLNRGMDKPKDLIHVQPDLRLLLLLLLLLVQLLLLLLVYSSARSS